MRTEIEQVVASEVTGIESGEPTPFTTNDFAAIRERGIRRIKEK